jgi:hypothetical protein
MQESRQWRIRYNQELNWLCRSLDIIVTRWQGYDGQGIYKEQAIMKYPKIHGFQSQKKKENGEI